jgi:hypothetical protein
MNLMENNQMKQNVFIKYKRIFSILLFLISVILMLIILESTLYLLKYDNAYSIMQRYSCDKADWWINDSILGPRFLPNQFEKLDTLSLHWYYERLKIVNKQGYHDKDDFIDLPSDTNSIRALFIGDSFTWGASSDVDSSFVDVFEQRFKKTFPLIVWNAGIPATGTNYALHVTKRFLPLQKSNIVVLGFFGNDFGDNLIPFDRLQFSNKGTCLKCYNLDNSFNAIKISIQDAYKNATGAYPIENLNLLQREIIIKSRLVPLLNNIFERISQKFYQYTHSDTISKVEYSFQITKSYLNQLKNYVKENNAELVVLLIPDRQDIMRKSKSYLTAIGILRELEINFLEISDKFCEANYVQSENDGHWNNSGHKIAGTLLYEHILNAYRLKNTTNNTLKKEKKWNF